MTNNSRRLKIGAFLAWVGLGVSVFCFVFYSYSQTDLNLTFSSSPVYLEIQKPLTYLGYFRRDLSALIFSVFLALWTGFYLLLFRFPMPRRFTGMVMILGVAALGYSLFSHDLFNYMFDARILTYYGKNPYFFSAQDFSDDWVRFMHWTHRTYPYGPIWLIPTALISWIGAGKFVLTYLGYKVLFLCIHLTSTYLVYRISRVQNPPTAKAIALAFGLNPFLVIESVVSPHIDSLVLCLVLAGLSSLVESGRVVRTGMWWILSMGIKYSSTVLIPLLILFSTPLRKTIRNHCLGIVWILMAVSAAGQMAVREFQPWYMIPFVGTGFLLWDNRLIRVCILLFSVALLMSYFPYLLYGDGSAVGTEAKHMVFYTTGLLTIGIAGIFYVIDARISR